MKYFDFGIPISFGYTAQYLPNKTVTRRIWKDSHAAKFIRAFERAAADGKKLRVPAIDKAYHSGGKQIGWLYLNHAPYKEALKNMPHVDLAAEGGMCTTIEEFAAKFFKGDLDKEVWVIRFKFQFEFQEQEIEQCLELSNSSAALAGSALDLNQSADSSLLKPSKSAQPQELFIPTIFLSRQSGTTCELFAQHRDNLTALSAEVPAKTLAGAESEEDLTANTLPFGGKCSELSMKADLLSLGGKTLRELCTEELEKWLPASEWLDMKSRGQSSYRLRNSELRTSESEFSSLPTATTYPCGNGKNSPAGRNKLETRLRSRANIPTPRANDGMQGYNTGKSGGANLTGYLMRLATPAARDFKGTSPTAKTATSATLPDNLNPFICKNESLNPQVWGWMMGFPMNWAESVLIPPGFLESGDRDGGTKIPRLPKPEFQAKEF